MDQFECAIRRNVAEGDWALPYPGAGATAIRHRALCEFGRSDLSVARVAEAHTDALAILNEAGQRPQPDALYGVWASDGPHSGLYAKRWSGQWRIDGIKQYCSGATFVTAALVTAHSDGGLLLFDIPLHTNGIRVEASTWAAPAFSNTETRPVTFDHVLVTEDCLLGSPGWYLTRPGFWHGAIGPAACWAGGAMALVDAAAALNRRDPHSRAQIGALEAASWSLGALLEAAGREIDDDPLDKNGHGRRRALMVRHLVERTCTDVLDRFGRATGPQLLAFDTHVVQQHMALALYIRQCHGERDLATISQ